MIKEFAFIGIPVTDLPRARRFYEDVLGLKPSSEVVRNNIEYDVGEGTLMIADYGERWRPAAGGTIAAFEVDDVDAMTARVKASGAAIQMEPADSPVCRFSMVFDPDGNTLILHKRKQE
ncbi:MAG TPA: VOC family protein [Chthoniobacterales bacterium]|jgi:predicted enzyme related to lactoylglutathione lyase|nr:VOC family protein [Chthoniobacterales bacterium]